tara:strand:- start:379 stop:558 length:180 start_codon:yes stop_codon:yes gene_type:complete
MDLPKLEEMRRDCIKWTKKLYDIHRQDRFLTLVKIEENQKKGKAIVKMITEEKYLAETS